jgi:hypothetical protein
VTEGEDWRKQAEAEGWSDDPPPDDWDPNEELAADPEYAAEVMAAFREYEADIAAGRRMYTMEEVFEEMRAKGRLKGWTPPERG